MARIKGDVTLARDYLRAVLTRPWDADARLVYAGYLIDHGNRTQHALGIHMKISLERDDPNSCFAKENRANGDLDDNCHCYKCDKLELPDDYKALTFLDSELRSPSTYTTLWGMPDRVTCTMAEFARLHKRIFAEFPVSMVVVYDRAPSPNLRWFEARSMGQLKVPSFVPSDFFHKLSTVPYDSVEAAQTDLNEVCYREGRRIAGYPTQAKA